MNEFNTTKQSGNVGIFLSHVGFVGPNTMVQPSHQIHIVGYAPRKLLRSVDMRVNKPCGFEGRSRSQITAVKSKETIEKIEKVKLEDSKRKDPGARFENEDQ